MRVKFSGKSMKMEVYVLVFMAFMLCFCGGSFGGLISQRAQPLNPDDNSNPNTVPAFPVQSETQTCRLDLSDELFGGVSAACGRDLDRSRCCPVLAAWLFAAHARTALQISAAAPPSGSDLPMVPDDNQKCVNSLQGSLQRRNIHLPQPNASCDAVLCFCGIRLHQITSLTCSAAFNLTAPRNATPTAALANLERNCRNASYSGCTKCLGALQKLNGGAKNGTHKVGNGGGAAYDSDRVTKMFNRDCQLMGLTWLLARNKTAYIPTVSAVLRAIMYSAHPPHDSKCSPDQENMPLAVNSLQFQKSDSSSSSSSTSSLPIFFPTLPLIILAVNILFINYY
ncbi:PREDICTED: uncharacterized GPI-anchored protein At4g28100-like isoform X1 [Ipomoea nil]|nr:PREDICTED: uncharacterized GPI-anchored protein At4g28100-like isoform X1 [Ipomoea nil]XP_019192888.1 PREDICTED: uncharacterized GPI-anchored protein At4g28100-like isoform X1 [Ipomoea nil]XP_019192890.1 PREDICTED: uncharacterized GPI-anchored protein At4g28100-like isoform X1 [Ipomoea nil]